MTRLQVPVLLGNQNPVPSFPLPPTIRGTCHQLSSCPRYVTHHIFFSYATGLDLPLQNLRGTVPRPKRV